MRKAIIAYTLLGTFVVIQKVVADSVLNGNVDDVTAALYQLSPEAGSPPPAGQPADHPPPQQGALPADHPPPRQGAPAPPPLTDEQRLLSSLMARYDRHTRPVINASHPVVVKLGITLNQVFDVDERNQVLTTHVWLDHEWADAKLQWNPRDYNNLRTLRIPPQLLWKPDIVLYNSADDYTSGYMPALAMVNFDGSIFWPPIVKLRSTCKIDITYFPFDDQLCHLKFGSWAYDGLQVDVVNRSQPIDLSNYVSSGEWDLLDVKVKRKVMYYGCCPEPYPDITFSLHMRRRTIYYTYNVIIPCLMLSSLTLLAFWMPPEGGEKVPQWLHKAFYRSERALHRSLSSVRSVTSHKESDAHRRLSMQNGSLKSSAHNMVATMRRGTIVNNLTEWSHCNQGQGQCQGQCRCSQLAENYRSILDEEQTDNNNQRRQMGVVVDKLDKILKQIDLSTDPNRAINREWIEIAEKIDRILFWLYLLICVSSTVCILVVVPLYKNKRLL